MVIANASEFQRLVDEVEAQPGYERPAAFGLGIATFEITDLDHPTSLGPNAATLDTWYPVPNLGENLATAAVLARVVGHRSGTASYRLESEQLDAALAMFAPFLDDDDAHKNVRVLRQLQAMLESKQQAAARYAMGEESLPAVVPTAAVVSFIGDLAGPPVDAHDSYLRLHLLSARKIPPHGCNLDGIFGKLTNVVWTNVGPFAVADFEAVRMLLRSQGVHAQVLSIDKFPRMADYVIPTGIRLADADRARLGAHLGEGTTVMHEGFVNFNAGTLGTSMVEGRISAGVVVGKGSDLGGSASIMGTLSGGGTTINSVGENCLLGANSGCGIPLGNNCTIEAGCYVTGGAKVRLPDGAIVKASELAGKDDLLFIRNSQTGAIEVRYKRNETRLNEALHKN